MEEPRWKERFNNFQKAFLLLKEAIEQYSEMGLNELKKQGLIQRFEFTHELAWKVLKDYFEFQGIENITGPRDATREAFNSGLIEDGESWMEMIKSRNQSSHTYNEQVAQHLLRKISESYFKLFIDFREKLQSIN